MPRKKIVISAINPLKDLDYTKPDGSVGKILDHGHGIPDLCVSVVDEHSGTFSIPASSVTVSPESVTVSMVFMRDDPRWAVVIESGKKAT